MNIPQKRTPFTILAALVAVLAAVAAAGGLFIPDLYRDSETLVPVLRGQDFVTLPVALAMLSALYTAGRGSTRGALIWIGLMGYMLYTYTGASFAYTFNKFFPIYVALFALTIFTLVDAVRRIDTAALQRRFDSAAPRKPVAVFLFLIALALGFGEVMQILPFYTTGTLPEPLVHFGASTYFVYVLDLGIIVPLSLLAGVWLWRGVTWGYVLGGCMLIKAGTMGFALLSMNWFAVQAGQSVDSLLPLWVLIAFGGLVMALWFFRHCHDDLTTADEPLRAPA